MPEDDRDEQIRQTYPVPQITIEDFIGWLLTKEARGMSQGLLLKQAMISINQLILTVDRWIRLEEGREQSAPLWVSRSEADVLVKALTGVKGAKPRLLRQTIRDLFE